MLRYIAGRLAGAVGVLLVLSILVFLLLQVIPGTAADQILGAEGANSEVARAELVRKFGLDRPLLDQYGDWLRGVAVGDLGTSWRTDRPVSTTILDRLPLSLEIAIGGILVAVLVGIPLGMVAARRRDSVVDHVLRVFTLFGSAVPVYVTATVILLLGSLWLRWIPPTGYVSLFTDPGTNLLTVATPAVLLGLTGAASVAKITRGSMLDVLQEEYVRTAVSRGFSPVRVTVRHALRNASVPILTVIGLETGTLLGGVVVTETVLSLPGLGRLVIDSIGQRDFPVVQGTVLVIGALFVGLNLVTDVLYGLADPRIRLTRTERGR
jgi:peptide/nickel transport system permease protein